MEEITHGTVQQVVSAVVPTLGESAVIAVPSGDAFRGTVNTLAHDLPEAGTQEPVTLLAESAAVRPLVGRDRDYGLAMRVAELEESGRVQTLEAGGEIPVLQLAGPDRVAVCIVGDHRVYGVCGEAADPSYFHSMLRTAADRAQPVAFDLPSVSTVSDALADRFDPMVAAAFENTLVQVRSAGNRAIDAPKLLLWVGARYELSFDDLQQLVEDVGLLSHQPFSSRLSQLVNAGLVVAVPEVDGPGHPTRKLELAIEDPGDGVSGDLVEVFTWGSS